MHRCLTYRCIPGYLDTLGWSVTKLRLPASPGPQGQARCALRTQSKPLNLRVLCSRASPYPTTAAQALWSSSCLFLACTTAGVVNPAGTSVPLTVQIRPVRKPPLAITLWPGRSFQVLHVLLPLNRPSIPVPSRSESPTQCVSISLGEQPDLIIAWAQLQCSTKPSSVTTPTGPPSHPPPLTISGAFHSFSFPSQRHLRVFPFPRLVASFNRQETPTLAPSG